MLEMKERKPQQQKIVYQLHIAHFRGPNAA